MIVRRLIIRNFRAIRSAELHFEGSTLLLGPNNVGKSTVLEALDLALGPDRVNRADPICEHDFYAGRYLPDGDDRPEIRIEVVLTDLSSDVQRQFRRHLEFWKPATQSLSTEGPTTPEEADAALPALRVQFRGWYDPAEDEFQAETTFCHPPPEEGGRAAGFTRRDKRICGFLYLRSLRTGTRALSLDRGSSLDVLLSLVDDETSGLWERLLNGIRGVGPTLGGDPALASVLDRIDGRLREFIPLPAGGTAGGLQVTNLTRQELRKAISYFLGTAPSDTPVPFRLSGAGTLNVLVFSLLTCIAELKPHGVIFAMEEPEISIPPHTQRRVIRRLRDQSAQCLVTSHAPYVAEGFVPDGLMVLRRGPDHELIACRVIPGAHVKRKSLIRDFRTRFAEGMLGRAVLAVEGVSERLAVHVVAEKLAAADGVLPLDALGVTVIDATGEGGQGEIGRFFQNLGLPTYVFADTSKNYRVREQIHGAFGCVAENPCKSLEEFLTTTLPVARLREFVRGAHGWDSYPDVPRLPATATEDDVRVHVRQVLTARKGEGYAAELLALCQASEMPEPLAGLIRRIHRELSPATSTAVRSSP